MQTHWPFAHTHVLQPSLQLVRDVQPAMGGQAFPESCPASLVPELPPRPPLELPAAPPFPLLPLTAPAPPTPLTPPVPLPPLPLAPPFALPPAPLTAAPPEPPDASGWFEVEKVSPPQAAKESAAPSTRK